MFEIGKRYRTFSGKIVTIIGDNSQRGPTDPAAWPRGYECVEGDDISPETGETIWRYNRENDYGRVCGGGWDNRNNLIPCAI